MLVFKGLSGYRDVTTGATYATMVAPKFSGYLPRSPAGGGGGRFCPPLQRSHLSYGYVPEVRYFNVYN